MHEPWDLEKLLVFHWGGGGFANSGLGLPQRKGMKHVKKELGAIKMAVPYNLPNVAPYIVL